MLHNQVIADIIIEIKRAPQIVSEGKYNEWYTRILEEMEKRERPLVLMLETVLHKIDNSPDDTRFLSVTTPARKLLSTLKL